jgi:hypothetical protein
MAEFFQAPTLDKLAERIEGNAIADLTEWVPLQPLGDGLPLLWLDGGPTFMALAQAMGTDRPFLGLPLGPILERTLQPGMAFEQMALGAPLRHPLIAQDPDGLGDGRTA